MKKPLATLAAITLLALTGCTAEPEHTKDTMCEAVAEAAGLWPDGYYEVTTGIDGYEEITALLMDAQESAAAIEATSEDDVLKGMIREIEDGHISMEDFITVDMSFAAFDDECRFA